MPRPLEATWPCHICGENRPASAISTERHKRPIPGTNTLVMEEVHYCNDKAECTAAAPRFTFMEQRRKPVTATRRVRTVGE